MAQSNESRAKGGFHEHPENINRKGRPKKSEFQEILDTFLAVKEQIELSNQDGTRRKVKMERAQILLEKMFRDAVNKDGQSRRMLIEHRFGRPISTMELITQDNDFSVTLKIVKPEKPKKGKE
jgi:hypothetical protein